MLYTVDYSHLRNRDAVIQAPSLIETREHILTVSAQGIALRLFLRFNGYRKELPVSLASHTVRAYAQTSYFAIQPLLADMC